MSGVRITCLQSARKPSLENYVFLGEVSGETILWIVAKAASDEICDFNREVSGLQNVVAERDQVSFSLIDILTLW